MPQQIETKEDIKKRQKQRHTYLNHFIFYAIARRNTSLLLTKSINKLRTWFTILGTNSTYEFSRL